METYPLRINVCASCYSWPYFNLGTEYGTTCVAVASSLRFLHKCLSSRPLLSLFSGTFRLSRTWLLHQCNQVVIHFLSFLVCDKYSNLLSELVVYVYLIRSGKIQFLFAGKLQQTKGSI